MRYGKKIFFIIVFILLLVISLGFLYLKGTAPDYNGLLICPSVNKKIIIERNKWGVPKIEAESLKDLFFAIGFVHAQDRLFQMDLARRLAEGRLSEIFGKIAFESDKIHKELLIEESMEKSYKYVAENPEIYLLLKSYCDGVNFFIKRGKLPIEFKILKYKPEKWEVRDILTILKNMEMILEDSGSELRNMNLVRILGKERAAELIYGNFGSSIVNEKEYEKIYDDKKIEFLMNMEKNIEDMKVGSDNWVVSGKRTISGFPLLANDPHLPNRFPGYFYQLIGKVKGTDIELSGNTIAGTPFIVIGRNRYVGWGFTNVGTDVIDYYILKINPENKNQYFVDGKWKEFKIIEKKVKVKGEGERVVKVKISVFGPVIESNEIIMARHSVFLYPSEIFKALYGMNFAKNIDEFIKAVSHFTAPAQNIIFADTKGNIGYYPSGVIPIRAKGDGSLPVEVTKTEESWKGFYNEKYKPIVLNPDKGYIATANNPVLPESKLPNFSKHSIISFRADTIKEFFDKKEKFSIEDMKKLQLSPYSKAAEFLINSIKGFKFKDKKALFVFNKLTDWNFNMDKGITPYLFYKFEKELSNEIFSDEIKGKKDKRFISVFWIYRIMKYPKFEEDESFKDWVDDKNTEKKESFKEIVKRALIKTYEIYKKDSEKENLRWENIHKVFYLHPLGRVKFLGYFFNRGPFYMAGGRSTILRADFNPRKNFNVTHFSTFRIILDFSDFSKSLMINSTGQSGNFLSKFYDDQLFPYITLNYNKMEDFSKIKYKIEIIPER